MNPSDLSGILIATQTNEVIELNRSFKTMIAVLLLLVALVGLFTGCHRKKTPEPTPTPTAAAAETAAPAEV